MTDVIKTTKIFTQNHISFFQIFCEAIQMMFIADFILNKKLIRPIFYMKRKTANQIQPLYPTRTLKKNKSCQLNQKLHYRSSKYLSNSLIHHFISGETIANILIIQLLESLEPLFRLSDQQHFYRSLHDNIQSSVLALGNMMDPLQGRQNNDQNLNLIQPIPISGDLLCGGAVIAFQAKIMKKSRISIIEALDCKQHKREKSNLRHGSKNNISTHNLIKLPKEQILQRRGLEELKRSESYTKDTLQDTLREKAIKQKRNSYFNMGKIENLPKNNFLPSIQEYSFDYDGTLIPIKKNPGQAANRIKIVNTACKIGSKNIIQQRKDGLLAKLQGAHLKTEVQQIQKQNKQYVLDDKRTLSLRRQSGAQSLKDLLRMCQQPQQTAIKQRIEEFICNKSIKIRQLKLQ